MEKIVLMVGERLGVPQIRENLRSMNFSLAITLKGDR